MNCNRFRFLIQQAFEMELTRQDAQLLDAHLDSCQSCGRFKHQLEQVIQEAAELPLPDEALPTNLESLARMIMQSLPQPKASVFAIFTNLFGGGKPRQAKPAREAQALSGSRFPHVKRQPAQATQAAPEQATSGGRVKKVPGKDDEQRATATRLRGLAARSQPAEQQSQSQSGSRSLGEKFGLVAAGQEQAQEEQPLTLAEQIRRQAKEQQAGAEPAPAAADGAGWGPQTAAPAVPGGPPFGPPPNVSPGTLAAAGQGQATPGSPGGWTDTPGGTGQAAPDQWSSQPGPAAGWPQPSQPAAEAGWGGAPQGGAWDEPGDLWGAPAQQPPVPGQPTQAADSGWGAPQPADSGWGTPQPAADSGWGAPQPADSGWGAGAPQSPGGWGAPQAADSGWGSGGAQTQGAWGAPQPAGGDWGTPAAPQGGTWDEQAAPGASPSRAWSDEAEQIQTGMWQAFTPGDSLGATAKPKPEAPPPPQPAAADRWDTPIQQRQAAAIPGATPAAAEGERWDTPIQERMKLKAGAAQPPAQAAAPPAASTQGVPADSIMNRLSNILGSEGAQAEPPAPAAERWDTPIQERAPQAAQGAERWDTPIQERAQQAAQGAAVPGADRWDTPIQERAQPAQPQPSTAAADRFDVPIQERLPQAAPQPADRWDTPIQERAQPASPQMSTPAADRFDVPIQERLKQQGQAGAAPQPQESGGLFKGLDDSAMDQIFSANLGINEAARPLAGEAASPPPAPPPAPPQPAQAQFNASPPAGGPTITPVSPRTPPPQPTQAPPPGQPEPQGGLFKNLDDSAIDRIFSDNLGVAEQARQAAAAPTPPPVPPQSIPPAPPPVPPLAPPPAPPAGPPQAPQQGGWSAASQAAQPAAYPQQAAQPAGGGLFNIDDDTLDKLFADNLGVKESAPVPRVNVNEAVQSIRSVAGAPAQPAAALAPQAQPAAKVEGIGRLSAAESQEEVGPGKIASIGKFLLDQQDLGKIGKLASADLSDTKMRILTMEAAQELQTLLKTIGAQPGVVGSVIVGHDGILIANGLPQDFDPESVGVWALGVYLNTDTAVKKMGHNHVHQLVARTPRGYLIIADFGGGILVTVTEGAQTERLIPLMRSITQLVAQ